ncbi:MAG TPA: hypothetical protein VJ779_18275 [Acetobacteraceae bacterium]|jgi:hypothetical protein|nr:hypothetical protein [Acetobacteraceae bacterium]
MGRTAIPIAAALALLAPFAAPVRGQQAGPPHAFLFGAWTGGLVPPPSTVTAQGCLAQPTVIFTRDVVMRATLTDILYVQRAIETARGTGDGVDIRLVPQPNAQAALGGLGLGASGTGFGCPEADLLHVQRISANEISFPGCRDFPFPLVRCPAG